MTDTPLPTSPLDTSAGPIRVDVTSAFDRLRILTSSPRPAAGVMDQIIGVLVPAIADRCVVELAPAPNAGASGPAAPVLMTTSVATGRTVPVTVRSIDSMSVSFASAVDDGLHGSVSCSWNGGYHPSEGDAAVVQAIVDQCVLLTDRARLAASMEQLQAHTGQLRTAVESNRRIGAAIGVLMVRYGLTEDGAFEALRRTSNTSNRKLREVADEVLYTGSLPEQRTASRAQ